MIAVVSHRAAGYAVALAQGIDAVYPIVPGSMSWVGAMRVAGSLLEEDVAEQIRVWLAASLDIPRVRVRVVTLALALPVVVQVGSCLFGP